MTRPANLDKRNDGWIKRWNAGLNQLTITAAAAKLGTNAKTLKYAFSDCERRGVEVAPPSNAETIRGRARFSNVDDELQISQPPDDDLSVDELLDMKRKLANRKIAKSKWSELIPVQVKLRGPICPVWIGDPHIDDDGCDIEALERDLRIIRENEGMYAGHLGDLTNNWVGRLATKYANQLATRAHGIKLTEWMLEQAPVLMLIGGNHDCWNDGMDLVRFIMRQQRATVQPHGARIELKFPNGNSVRVHARHDFPGHSQYNQTHGMRKETLFGFRDHLLLCGHKHVDEAHATPSAEGLVHWMFRVSGYKRVDDYSDQNRFMPQHMAPALATIIDPDAKVPAEIIKPFWDLEAAADYLKFRRKAFK